MIGAKTAIWITSFPREEHIKAIEWLNELTPADYSFYLIRIEAIRIDKLVERNYNLKDFWTSFFERSKDKKDLFNNIPPRFNNWVYNWFGTGA